MEYLGHCEDPSGSINGQDLFDRLTDCHFFQEIKHFGSKDSWIILSACFMSLRRDASLGVEISSRCSGFF